MSEIQHTTQEHGGVDGAAELLGKKWQVCFGLPIDLKLPNLHAAANMLYDTVFDPEKIIAKYGIPPSETYPEREHELSSRITRSDVVVPEREEFVAKVLDAVSRNYQDYQTALYPGALETLGLLMKNFPTMMWTEGDTRDYEGPSKFLIESEGVVPIVPSGSYTSHEQLRKLIGSGIGRLRRDIALHDSDNPRRPQDVLQVIAENDKFSPEVVQRIVAFCRDKGLSSLYVVDDRVKNLQRIHDLLGAEGITVHGVWVRQGARSEVLPEGGYTPWRTVASVDKVAEGEQSIINGGTEGTGVLFDYDGVMSNQKTRAQIQKDRLVGLFTQEGWI